jgi:isopenicillin-N N-acyltransferase-like protein
VSIRVVDLAGSPRERGRAHGETLRGEIGELHGAFVGLMAAPEEGAPPVPEAEMVAYARRHEPFVAAAAPDLLEEMRGIAEGANLPFDAIPWVADGPPCGHPFAEFRAGPTVARTGLRAVS